VFGKKEKRLIKKFRESNLMTRTTFLLSKNDCAKGANTTEIMKRETLIIVFIVNPVASDSSFNFSL
jgi:hypothetical protein